MMKTMMILAASSAPPFNSLRLSSHAWRRERRRRREKRREEENERPEFPPWVPLFCPDQPRKRIWDQPRLIAQQQHSQPPELMPVDETTTFQQQQSTLFHHSSNTNTSRQGMQLHSTQVKFVLHLSFSSSSSTATTTTATSCLLLLLLLLLLRFNLPLLPHCLLIVTLGAKWDEDADGACSRFVLSCQPLYDSFPPGFSLLLYFNPSFACVLLASTCIACSISLHSFFFSLSLTFTLSLSLSLSVCMCLPFLLFLFHWLSVWHSKCHTVVRAYHWYQ